MAYVAIADRDHHLHDPQTFIEKYIWSQDHKVIAIQYGTVAIGVGLVALVLSLLMRLQIGFPDTYSFITPYNYYQFVTMHGMIMVIYLLTALFLGGFGNYLIPLMCGARDMVFPYMNMLSFWVYLVSVIVLLASFFVPGGPTGAGWTLYPPQTVLEGTPGADWGIVMMLASLAIFIVAFTMGGLNYVTTVLQARCRGMTLMRMPLSVWGIFVATILGLLAFPALLVAAIMMLLDRLIGTSFFMPALLSLGEQSDHQGGSPILFQHLFWFFGHPEVYIVALPAFGIVSDLLATHARKNIFGYRMMVWAIVAIGALSFVVWAHHMYVSGMNPYFGFFFATTTLIIAVPTAIKVYNWVLTLWRGNIQMNIPNLFAIGFIFTFVHGGLTGLFLGNVTVDLPLSDTYFVIGHFHMVMGVSPVMVLFGAIYHWFPKMTGKMPNELLGRIHFWMTFLGTYAIYLPMHYLGILGMPRRYYAYGNTEFIPESAHAVNEAITIAAIVVATAQVIFIINVVYSLMKGKRAESQSLGSDDARVADSGYSARARQLGAEAARRLPLGLRLQRPRGSARLHSAERAAERAQVVGLGKATVSHAHRLINCDADRHHGVVAVGATAQREAVDAARRPPDEPGDRDVVRAEGRVVGVPCDGDELVRHLRERLHDACRAHARRDLVVAAAQRAANPLVQHRAARARERGAADRSHACGLGRPQGAAHLLHGRRCAHACLSGRTDLGLGAAERVRQLRSPPPCVHVLHPADRGAWTTHARRHVRVDQDRCTRLARRRFG